MLSLSVVIPVHNRFGQLFEVMAALNTQTLASELFEIVLVDDASTEQIPVRLLATIADMGARFIRLEKNAGRSAARNVGLRSAQGEFVLFLDADSLPDSSLLARHLDFHLRQKNGCLLGLRNELEWIDKNTSEQSLLHLPESAKKNINNDLRLDILLDPEFERLWKTVGWAFAYTNNISYPRSMLVRIGGFNERLSGWGGEDQELALRAWTQFPELAFSFDPEARCGHLPHLRNRNAEKKEMFRNLDAVFQDFPIYQFELFYAFESRGFLRRLSYYSELKTAIQASAIGKTGSDCYFEHFPQCSGPVLYIGNSFPHTKEAHSFDFRSPLSTTNAHCFGIKIPFKDIEFIKIISFDVWRYFLLLDLSRFIEEAFRRTSLVELVWTKGSKERDSKGFENATVSFQDVSAELFRVFENVTSTEYEEIFVLTIERR